ncbi:hypothetical protein ABZ702_35115, partial [Streptomyces cyaneofuscatus]|uniref:hypothetical protein n=1 Tax=Streptomyces cyaneofuscatus TaxID=66883 RepID=UPI0033C9F041
MGAEKHAEEHAEKQVEKHAEDQEAVYLPGGRWRLWEQFSLRGPGFPVGGVLDLAPVDVSVYA